MTGSKAWPMTQLWRNDEEMAKKDDDRRHGPKRGPGPGLWTAARVPRRGRVLRVVAWLLLAAAAVVVLLRATGSAAAALPSRGRFMPAPSDIKAGGAAPRRHEPRPPSLESPRAPVPYPYANKASSRTRGAEQGKHYYKGPVTQPALVESLRAVTAVSPGSDKNRNVLFAAASLRSASTLLPLACQMAAARQNQLHFVYVGRDDIPLGELLKINGIDSTCPVAMHDARPDHAAASTDARMTLAAERAIAIFHRIIHPHAILIDSTNAEEPFFHRGVRDQARLAQSTLIELPEKPQSRLAWIAKLDTSALAGEQASPRTQPSIADLVPAWNRVHFDIVVHSPPTGSGNIKRLLRSLARADLGGHSIPHLLVEIPSVIETPLARFLNDYRWPPPYPGEKLMSQMLSLRRRIPRERLTAEESSARFLESFWPSDPLHSHVLVLSPNMEVGPHFFHYIKYSLLLHRHSRAAAGETRRPKMMAMSLSVPTTVLGSTRPFTPPRPLQAGEAESAAGTPFLWQTPTSDAVLIMGEKWIELHGYVSRVLERQHSVPASLPMLASEVGQRYPAWMEYALQLSRLRGYLTLYPSRQTADAIAGAHTDLPHVPEEYQGQAGSRDKDADTMGDAASVVFDVGSQVDMLEVLPGEERQQPLSGLPVLSWDGQQTKDDALEVDAMRSTAEFRSEVGGCSGEDLERPTQPDGYAMDLFCRAAKARG